MNRKLFLFLYVFGFGISVQAQDGFTSASMPVAEDSLETTSKVFARFVPERDDDFAWENDCVAFRAYGPALQKKAEQGKPGGLVTSGIDCWFKRVDYPIINRWYKGMNYHKDHGEGLDCYNVGPSRGCGGTAIYHDGHYIVSKNFVSYKLLETTPDKAVFELHYAPVYIEGKPVTEIKTITIESGKNYYRCDVRFDAPFKMETLAVGLALHQGKGHVQQSSKGYVSYWENIRDAEVGTAVWCKASRYQSSHVESEGVRNLWLHIALKHNKATYYAGFTWTKAGHHRTETEWIAYIEQQLR